MKPFLLFLMLASTITGCAQNDSQPISKLAKHVGGSCEGCEAIFESPIPFKKLLSVDTLPDFNEKGPKLEISGIIYHNDGKSPAKDVVIYVYHTDQKGLYAMKGNGTGWGKRHGYIRGWLKTDNKGFYKFYTLKPAPYPGGNNPAHIHITIKEPDKNEYWIDEYLFDEDPILTKDERQKLEKRGGNGVIKTVLRNGILHGTRDIILGRNIPNYPKQTL